MLGLLLTFYPFLELLFVHVYMHTRESICLPFFTLFLMVFKKGWWWFKKKKWRLLAQRFSQNPEAYLYSPRSIFILKMRLLLCRPQNIFKPFINYLSLPTCPRGRDSPTLDSGLKSQCAVFIHSLTQSMNAPLSNPQIRSGVLPWILSLY